MSEAIRTCKLCGGQYTGWRCNSERCKTAREKRKVAARKNPRRRAGGGGGGRRIRAYRAPSFSWGTPSLETVAVHPDACPNQE